VYRILFVYIGLIFFQGLICPSSSPQLLNATSKAASSPFTIGFVAAGWKSAGQFINTLTIIAFISAGNGCIYVQSRALYSLALSGRAPKFFAITTNKGVPYVSILTSCCWGFLALMNMKIGAGQVFVYMTSVGGTAAYIAWSGIVFTHLRVRAGLDKQGISPSTFPFKVFGTIWIYRFNLFLNIFILLIQGFTAFEQPFKWRNFIASYITLPSSIILFVGYKLYYKTRWVRLSEMDFSDRLTKVEDEEEDKPNWSSRLISKFRD
jgi:amino acid transporter